MTTTTHDVLYIHTCTAPKRGPLLRKNSIDGVTRSPRRVHAIQYESAEHEFANLQTQREHLCPWCDRPMQRLGTFVVLGAQEPTAELLEFAGEEMYEHMGSVARDKAASAPPNGSGSLKP